MIQSTMIRASAGSGKTWQLANRYLSLMVLGAAPEKIIALTFTRKAAGEFTSRIMTRLAKGAADDASAEILAVELKQIILGSESIPALVTERSDGGAIRLPEMNAGYFQGKLEELVEVMDRLALSTLDSYFVRIVRNFALELGLSGFDLMEDSAIASERLGVMRNIFSNHQTSHQERDAFLQSFKQATWGEEENRLCQTLEDFVKNHQNRWLSAPEMEKWGSASLLWPEESGGCPLPEGGDYVAKAKRVVPLIESIENIHGSYRNSWLKACEWMEDRVPGTSLGKPPARIGDAMIALSELKSGSWMQVFSKRDQLIEGALAAAIYDMVGALVRDEIEIRIKRTQGLYAVISAYEQNYHENVRSRGRLCFSDLTMLLAGQGAMAIWDEDARSLIDYRLDARYDHWLLDEFQDTSQPQWKAVGTLVDEILQDSEGDRSVFVVGDSKQSIYGWRGGEPRLFDDLQKHYGQRLAEWEMDKSYRSSQHVLDLVNTVCDLSDPKWRDIFPAAAVDRWVFHPHQPSEHKPGHTLVLETGADVKASSDEKEQARYVAVKALLEKTQPLENQHTCAILVTKNDQATSMVEYLRRELPGMPVAPESETLATDGPEGAVILDLFRWLSHPSDDFARLHVSYSPLAKVVHQLTDTDMPAKQWQWLTQQIARHGLEALVRCLIKELRQQVKISEYGESRLDEVLSAAAEFSAGGGSLSEWVALLESRKIRENTREGMIQVMTVHKSKGLGFDVVILPELGGQGFAATSRLEMLERKGELGSTEYIIRKPAKEVCEADASLKEMLADWEAEQCYERFCNLYVALTRAKHATYCILDPVKDQWSPGPKYDDWIREATSRAGDTEVKIAGEKYPVLFQSGDWLKPSQSVEKRDKKIAAGIVLKKATPRMARKIASAQKDAKMGSLLQGGKGMNFGNIVHQHFEKITWLDEMPELDDKAAADLVRECLEVPEISKFFERPTGDYQLLREQPFETRDQDAWLSGVIDRAVITLEKGQASHVSIIDFKTDQKDAAELQKAYAVQLEVYRNAMARITGVPAENITCHLLSTHLKQMVEV